MEGGSLGLFNSQSENAPTNPQNIDELKKIAKKKGSRVAPLLEILMQLLD